MSPPSSSSDDSPDASADNNAFFQDDIEMPDYEFAADGSQPVLFEGPLARFTSSQRSPELAPFSAAVASLVELNHSSPDFDTGGDSPGLGSEMHGLEIDSGFSGVPATVKLEDLMLPTKDAMTSTMLLPTRDRSMFENKVGIQRVGNGLFQSCANPKPFILF